MPSGPVHSLRRAAALKCAGCTRELILSTSSGMAKIHTNPMHLSSLLQGSSDGSSAKSCLAIQPNSWSKVGVNTKRRAFKYHVGFWGGSTVHFPLCTSSEAHWCVNNLSAREYWFVMEYVWASQNGCLQHKIRMYFMGSQVITYRLTHPQENCVSPECSHLVQILHQHIQCLHSHIQFAIPHYPSSNLPSDNISK